VTSPLTYAGAGVDIAAADESKSRIRAFVESTFTEHTRGAFGGFGGLCRAPAGDGQLLVASADGVGTKIKVAIDAGRHTTIGHDLVNHCANDILVQGALPLFFLDYVAFGKLVPSTVADVVQGVASGCRENGCALIGGETAEMPGLYTPPDYDLAGFIVGSVHENAVLGADRVRRGDVIVALASSGLHTNGYSLARRIVSERLRLAVDAPFPGMRESVADVLLAVHSSYVRSLREVLPRIHAMAHITGGGLPGNLSRSLPAGCDAVIERATWRPPHVFEVLAKAGGVEDAEMFRAFNMGIGMCVMLPASDADAVIEQAQENAVAAWVAGEVTSGDGRVVLH